MSAQITALVAAAAEALRAIDGGDIPGTGGAEQYTYKLCDSPDAVSRQFRESPPTDPFVYYGGQKRVTSISGPPLGKYERTLEIDFAGLVSGSDASFESREDAAGDLLNDIMNGVAVDRTLGGRAIEVEVLDADYWGTPDGVTQQYGVCSGTIRIVYRTKVGV